MLGLTVGSACAASAGTLPCKQPQLAADGGVVYLACGSGDAVKVAVSTDTGRTFGPLSTVATSSALALGAHRGPRVAVANHAVIVSAVVGVLGGGRDGDLVAWRSIDRGRTWSGPVTINDVPGSAREGLHAMAARGSRAVAAWLDLRGHGTRLYASISDDGGRTWAANVLVYQSPSGTICQCCHPSLAIAPDGRILAMFRNVVDGHRDFYFTSATDDRFAPAEKLGTGTWQLDACPMDGGGIVAAGAGGVETVWRRDKTVYLAGPGAPEVAVGEGVNPTLASTPRGLVVAWNAPQGLVIVTPGQAPRVLDPAGTFVELANVEGAVVAAWESVDGSTTRVIEATTP